MLAVIVSVDPFPEMSAPGFSTLTGRSCIATVRSSPGSMPEAAVAGHRDHLPPGFEATDAACRVRGFHNQALVVLSLG
jgi:hypothetical protein